MQPIQNNTPVRVKATKGFYANVAGQFGIINPGDVVDIDRHTATLVVSAGKAQQSAESPTRVKDYLPERKRNPKPTVESLLASLVRATEANTQAIAALVASQSKSAKKD